MTNFKLVALILLMIILPFAAYTQKHKTPAKTLPISDREYWLDYMDKLSRPVLSNLAHDSLKIVMPVVLSKTIDNRDSRSKVAYLEALGRVMSGIGPWLNTEGGSQKEINLRNQYRQWTVSAISNAVNPLAKDYMAWQIGGQPLVDAAFLALGIIRCPWLWEHLDETTKLQLVDAFKKTRLIKPGFNNWILFSGMIEAFFCKYNMDYDLLRIEYCIRQMEQWYVGDGMYSDGDRFHWDYYNSYVIQPFLSTIVETVNAKNNSYLSLSERIKKINERYAVIQERLINTDGSFPVIGRSIVYRGGAFHHLAWMASAKKLPVALKPAQVRSALTAVIKKTSESPTTYTTDGWLSLGLYGSQPDLADSYITTGSLYLCSTILLPLGLPESDEFWSAMPEPWTAKKVWSGMDLRADHAMD